MNRKTFFRFHVVRVTKIEPISLRSFSLSLCLSVFLSFSLLLLATPSSLSQIVEYIRASCHLNPHPRPYPRGDIFTTAKLPTYRP